MLYLIQALYVRQTSLTKRLIWESRVASLRMLLTIQADPELGAHFTNEFSKGDIKYKKIWQFQMRQRVKLIVNYQ